jgi:hypothetical protein
MSRHLERRTEVPRARDFFFAEQKYITQLQKYERERAQYDQSGAVVDGQSHAYQTTQDGLTEMCQSLTCSDSMRYDFIQHYIAYHRAKIHELDAAMAPVHPPATWANAPAYMQHLDQVEKMHAQKIFHQQQAVFLQKVLVHRAGRLEHIHRGWHSDGQRFYDAVPGGIAAVYEADRADRHSIAMHGTMAPGIMPEMYIGDYRRYPGRRGVNGEYLGEIV